MDGTCLKNIIVKIAEVEELFCFVAEVWGEVVFVEVVIQLEVAEVVGRVFHRVKVGRKGRMVDDVCQLFDVPMC